MSRCARALGGLFTLVLLAAALAVPLLARPAAGFGERTFQANPVAGPGDPAYYVYASSTLAQSFTVNTSFLIQKVTLRVENEGGPVNALAVSIHPDDPVRHVPVMGVVLASSSQVTPDNASAPTDYDFPFNPSALLAAGSTYWIVAENGASQGPPTNGYEWVESNANSFPGGSAYILEPGTGLWTGLPYDLYFVTFGREYAADLAMAVAANRSQAQPGDSVTFTIYFNNSGNETAPRVWINETLDSGLVDASLAFPTLAPISPATFPDLVFENVTNGAFRFTVTVHVDIGTSPGTVLGDTVSLRYSNTTGTVSYGGTAQASVLVGLATKQLFLGGTPVAPALLTTRRPTLSTLTTSSLNPGDAQPLDFQLAPVLAAPFTARNVTAALWIATQKPPPQTLRLNVSLLDDAAVIASLYPTLNVTRSGFQRYDLTFPLAPYTFAASHRIQLELWSNGSSGGSTDTLILSYNSTLNPSRLDLVTTTYVSIRTLALGNEIPGSSQWSPQDPILIEANVSDPFGNSRIAGTWINVTDPSGHVVLAGAMSVSMTDPSSVPAWTLFNETLAPPLLLGRYTVDVLAMEDNGLVTRARGSADVVVPDIVLENRANVTRARAGESFAYFAYFNNTGTSRASSVWLNVTLPSEVAFVTSSLAYDNVTGSTYIWSFANVTVGPHSLEIDVSILGTATTAAWIEVRGTLNLTDVNGHPLPGTAATADVFLNGPVLALSVTSTPTGTVHSNETVTYTIRIQNTGDAAATLWVNDTMPATFTYVSDTAANLGGLRIVSGNTVHFRFLGMPALAAWSFNLTLLSGVALIRDAAYSDAVSLSYTSATGFLMPPDLQVLTATAVAPWFAYGQVGFLLERVGPGRVAAAVLDLVNNGSEAASFAWVNLTLDARLTLVNASASFGGAGSSLQFVLTDAPAGPTRIYLNFSVSAATSNGALLQVLGSLDYHDGVGNPMPTVLLAPGSVNVTVAVLSLSVSPDNLSVEAGTTLPFTIAVTNTGGIATRDVWLNVTMPASFEYYADTSRTTLDVVGSAYSWQWTDQQPGPFAFSLFVKPRQSTPNGTVAVFPFRVDYFDFDGRPRPGIQATVEATVVAPRLVLSVVPNRTEVPSGGTLVYTLQVRNEGGSMAQLVSVTDDVDPRLRVATYDASVTAMGTQRLTWNFPDLLPGGVETISLTVSVAQGLGAGTLIPMALEVNYTNSAGLVLSQLRSAPVMITVEQDLSFLMWAGLGVLAILGFAVILRSYQTKVDIEDVFLVYRDGVLISHLSRTIMREKDEDVLSGMLTAVQEFVRDAFQYGEHRELHQLDFGEYRILIERGKYVYLAVVYAGEESPGIRKKVRIVIDRIEEAFGPALESWDGDMEQVVGARDMLATLLGTANHNHAAKPPATED